MLIEYSQKFIKEFKKCPPNIKNSFRSRLEILTNDAHSPILNNHQLSGKLKNFRSINITGDWRAVFEEINNGKIIYFIAIGSHSKLYS
ncbi:MAG: type II toxin-antitoxin system mRNA interferase toxin, RelE/StbE family [Candidatus Paceibacterota bacterium]|jgi:addiction module RelE/StbE family toxin